MGALLFACVSFGGFSSVVAHTATTLAECIPPGEKDAVYNLSCQVKAARQLPSTFHVAAARTRKHGVRHGTHSAHRLCRRFRCRLQGPSGCRQEERPRCVKRLRFLFRPAGALLEERAGGVFRFRAVWGLSAITLAMLAGFRFSRSNGRQRRVCKSLPRKAGQNGSEERVCKSLAQKGARNGGEGRFCKGKSRKSSPECMNGGCWRREMPDSSCKPVVARHLRRRFRASMCKSVTACQSDPRFRASVCKPVACCHQKMRHLGNASNV